MMTPFGPKNYLSEQGFYRAVMKSSHAAADEMIGKAAELFVQLRKTGVVTVADAVPQAELSRLEILTMALDAEKAKLAAEAKVAELEPAAEAYHGWLDNDGLVSVSDAWRMIKTVHRIHRDEFFALLRAWRVITVSGVTLQAWFVDKGYGTNIAVAYSENGQRLQGKVNPAGIDYLLKRLRKLS